MAKFLSWWKKFRETVPGSVITAIYYAVLLILVLLFFTGNGEFIYELK